MNDVDEVKSRLDIVQIIGKYVALKKAGRNLKGLCPFHSEKTPSFMVAPDRQVFHCFGCGKGGSAIDFVMEYEHIDFREALEELAEQVGVTLSHKVSTTPEEKRKEKILEIHHLAGEYYHYLLTKHAIGEKAREYLKKRGVSEKIIETFGLGYSLSSWDGLSKFLRKKNYEMSLLVESGLIIDSPRGGYDRFRGRLMFPLRDHRGQTIGFSGRLMDPDAKEAKYINSPETPIYIKGNMLFALDVTKGAIQKEQTAVVMEGEFDVLSSYQAGISNVVAIKGTALTEAQVNLLKRFTSKILFALDSDVAGDAASRRGIEIADRAGLEIHIASMPFGKDPDDVARSEPHLLKKAIAEAQTIYDYYVTSALKRHDVATAYGKKNISQELYPVFARITNSVVQSHYIHRLSDILGVSETVISDGLKKESKKTPLQDGNQTDGAKEVREEDKQELYLLSLLLQGDTAELMEDVNDAFDLSFISTPSIRQIIELLQTHLSDASHFFIKDFLDSLPKELLPTIDFAYLVDIGTVLDHPDMFSRNWQMTLKEVKKKSLRQQITTFTQLLKTAKEEDIDGINAKVGELASKLRLLEKQD